MELRHLPMKMVSINRLKPRHRNNDVVVIRLYTHEVQEQRRKPLTSFDILLQLRFERENVRQSAQPAVEEDKYREARLPPRAIGGRFPRAYVTAYGDARLDERLSIKARGQSPFRC
ncbi:unnamed protein product [Merluccius merluccius]